MRFEPYTSNTLVSHDALRKNLENTISRSYALDSEKYIDGVVASAVPVYNHLDRFYGHTAIPWSRHANTCWQGQQFLSRLQTASHQLSELSED